MSQNAQTPRFTAGASAESSLRTGGRHPRSVAASGFTPGDIAGLWASNQVTHLLADVDGPVPEYGSMEWVQLPPGDPRKVAAVIAAAEEFRQYVREETWMDELFRRDREAWHAELTANSYAPQNGRARDH